MAPPLSGDRLLRAVVHYDPALDLTEKQREEYAENRPDPSTLAVLPGMKPTVYHVRPISKKMMRQFVSTAEDVTTRATRAFLVGVSRVDNVVNEDTGELLTCVEPTGIVKNADGSELRVWNDAELEILSTWAVAEIGAVAFAYSDFPRGIARHYPLLRSSHLVWGEVARLHAAKSQRDALQSNGKQEQAATPRPDSSGDAPTDVTATA